VVGDPDRDRDRFDDVGYSIVEITDDAVGRPRRVSRRGAAAIAASLLAVGAVCAGAALALTPGSTPAAAPAPPLRPMHFAAETYPVRGARVSALHGGNCLHLHRHRADLAPRF
jgi:hypothetical protein